MSELRLGIIGDLHTHWDEVDVAEFNRTDFDLLFFTGDLGGGTPESTLRIARSMAGLEKPALVMPGNNDTWDTVALAAELAHQAGLSVLSNLRRGSEPGNGIVKLCGYSLHPFRREGYGITLIAGRPHSMGGPNLSFPEFMRETYGIESMSESEARLIQLVEEAPTRDVVFLSHNGPTGLGAAPDDPWGADFKPDGGDWGDPDLAEAIRHARTIGKRVRAVIAGHMHIRTRQGVDRTWLAEDESTHFVNAARVPRIFPGEDDFLRHHISMQIGAESLRVREVTI
jgi:uncharacterized protein (TIGR04168 family)